MKSSLLRLKNWLHLLFLDHGLIRICYQNFHAVGKNLYRSAQPIPPHFSRLQRLGITTIINLRGGSEKDFYYQLEKQNCDRLGIHLITINCSATSLMPKHDLLELYQVLTNLHQPTLVHCKSGADRSGFVSTLFKIFVDHQSYPKANQLKWYYGHLKTSETGVLDLFFETLQAFQQQNPQISTLEWINHHYDKQAIEQHFRHHHWSHRIKKQWQKITGLNHY